MTAARPGLPAAAPAVVLVVGLLVAGVLAASWSMSTHDAIVLLAWSAGGAAIAGVAAGILLHLVRRARLGTQAIIVALAPVVAVGIGVAGAAWSMFLSRHDLDELGVTLAGAGTVAVLAGIGLGRRLAGASRSVAVLARELADGATDGGPPTAGADAPGELGALARELEETSSRLAASRAEAAALERGRRELVAWVSHDLRTPLSGMRAMVEAMEDGVVTDEATVSRYHGTLLAEIERLSGLVDDLFVLATIEAGAVSLRVEPVSFDELVSDAVAGAAAKASTKGLELMPRLDGPAVVELSAAEVSRVIHNLLDNAIRHTPAGRSVRVETGLSPDGRFARLSVVDACGGIPEADIDRVFDLAYRGDAARSVDTGGGGLGLAVARGLVEAHAGDITVDNLDDGCRFVVDLPLRTTP